MKILILIDYQNDFIEGVLGSKEARAIAPRIEEKLKNWDGLIVYTMDSHLKDKDGTVESEQFPQHCVVNTEGWKIPEPISSYLKANASGFFKKTFCYPYWSDFLKEPEEICVCGIATDICVLTNTLQLRSLFPDARIVVDAACCAGTSPEHHQMALELLKMNCVEVENG